MEKRQQEISEDDKASSIYAEPQSLEIKSTQVCPKCGLVVDISVGKCPVDDTELTKPLGENRAFVGKYEFLSTIGVGGMGVIYKAKQVNLNKLVAVKMLQSHLTTEDAARRFRLEAQTASSLRHPNIVNIFDFGTTDNATPYMVMEYVEGQTLSSLLENGGVLSASEFVDIFTQACDGLAHAHSRGVLHRDIKPSNILISRTGEKNQVFLMDFGIAKFVEDTNKTVQGLTRTGEILGSPLYMSPEQARNGKFDPRSDLYSLGCVMYEALTGQPPFVGGSAVETLMMHATESPVPPSATKKGVNTDKRLEKIVLKLLQREPNARIQSAEQLANILQGSEQIEPSGENNLKTGEASNSSQPQAHQQQLNMRILLAGVLLILFAVNGFVCSQFLKTSNVSPQVKQDGTDTLSQAKRLLAVHNYDAAGRLFKRRIQEQTELKVAAESRGDHATAASADSEIAKCWLNIADCHLKLLDMDELAGRTDAYKAIRWTAAYDALKTAAPTYLNYGANEREDFTRFAGLYRHVLTHFGHYYELERLEETVKKLNS